MPQTQTMQQAKTVNKFWNVANTDGMNAELTLYGEIFSEKPKDWWTGEVIEGQYITPEGFLEDLNKIKNAKNITVKINSVGGDLYTGIAIHNALKALKADINVIVEGVAASAASIIACCGKVSVYPGSLFMIHGVAGFFYDYLTLDDLKKQVKSFDISETAIAEIYAQKTKMDVAKLRSMMTKETWMTGRQAMELGFADELLENETTEINLVNKNVLMVNGVKLDFTGHKIPKELIMQNKITQTGGKKPMAQENDLQKFLAGLKNSISGFMNATDEEKVDPKEKEEDEKENLNKKNEELSEEEKQQKENAIKKRIENAVLAERKRIEEIDKLPSNVSIELKNAAKYGEKICNAGDLAMFVLQQNDPTNQSALNSLINDAGASNSGSVAGSSATPDNLTKEQEKINQAKEFMAQRKAKKTRK